SAAPPAAASSARAPCHCRPARPARADPAAARNAAPVSRPVLDPALGPTVCAPTAAPDGYRAVAARASALVASRNAALSAYRTAGRSAAPAARRAVAHARSSPTATDARHAPRRATGHRTCWHGAARPVRSARRMLVRLARPAPEVAGAAARAAARDAAPAAAAWPQGCSVET